MYPHKLNHIKSLNLIEFTFTIVYFRLMLNILIFKIFKNKNNLYNIRLQVHSSGNKSVCIIYLYNNI